MQTIEIFITKELIAIHKNISFFRNWILQHKQPFTEKESDLIRFWGSINSSDLEAGPNPKLFSVVVLLAN